MMWIRPRLSDAEYIELCRRQLTRRGWSAVAVVLSGLMAGLLGWSTHFLLTKAAIVFELGEDSHRTQVGFAVGGLLGFMFGNLLSYTAIGLASLISGRRSDQLLVKYRDLLENVVASGNANQAPACGEPD